MLVEVVMKRASLIVVICVLVSLSFIGLRFLPDARATTLFVGGVGPGNYTTIQVAIDDANPGDTIYVFNGDYSEKIRINKTLTLMGENREATIIQGNAWDDVIYVSADWVNITGFNVRYGGMWFFDSAIELDSVRNCLIANNNITSNYMDGIVLTNSESNSVVDNIFYDNYGRGVALRSSSKNVVANNHAVSNYGPSVSLILSQGNVITNNTLLDNPEGVSLLESANNTIAGNMIVNDPAQVNVIGLLISHSANNTMTSNTMIENGIFILGDSVEHWNTHTIDTSNTVNGKPVYYWKDVVGGEIPSGAGEVILANCTGVLIENQNVNSGSVGIELGFSSDNTIVNNSGSFNNVHGIYVAFSDRNTITGNNASLTSNGDGIHVEFSNGSSITGNTAHSNIYGIFTDYSGNSTISSNTVSGNDHGIGLRYSDNSTVTQNDAVHNHWGVSLGASYNNTIANNDIEENWHGIALWISKGNIVAGNSVVLSDFYGIYFGGAVSDVLTNNTMIENGIFILGDSVEHWNTHTIDTSNTVNGKPVYYWKDVVGGEIPSGAGEVILANCTGVLIENQNVNSGSVGIELGFSSDNTIVNNSASFNNVHGMYLHESLNNVIIDNNASSSDYRAGIYLDDSRGNTVRGNSAYANFREGITLDHSHGNQVINNTVSGNGGGISLEYSDGDTIASNVVSDNSGYGIALYYSDGNWVYHNHLVDNSPQAYDNRDTNTWDDGYPSGGNYWSDYIGVDQMRGPNQNLPGSDGIGDTSYWIDADSVDRYPLMFPFGKYHSPPTRLQASLSGEGLENVTLSWFVSQNDGNALKPVFGYEIFRNTTYDRGCQDYEHIAFLPNGTSEFVDINRGEGDPNNYFYRVCAKGPYNYSACSLDQAAKFTRPLMEGPSLVSIPLLQSNTSIERVLQTVNWDKAWYFDSFLQEWQWNMKDKTYSRGLLNVDHTMGLWVSVTEESNLTVAGVVPIQTVMHLSKGWNLVSFPSFNADYGVSNVMAEIGAWRVEGYEPMAPFHLRVFTDGEALQAGCGYWIGLKADAVWVVPAS